MRTFLGTIFSLGMVSVSMAQVLNPSFELGGSALANWQTVGHAIPMTNTIGINPVAGSRMAMAITASDGTVNANVIPGNGVSGAAAEGSFRLRSGVIAEVGAGRPISVSGIVQSVTLEAGMIVRFRYNFLTNQTYNDGTNLSIRPDSNNNDFCFVSFGGEQTSVTKLADTFLGFVNNPNLPGGFASGFSITARSNPFISESGWRVGEIKASAAGTYFLGFGVVHASAGADNGVNSALLVDDIQVVPEPATLIVLAGLAAGVARRRKS
jgi:hypothetical protein